MFDFSTAEQQAGYVLIGETASQAVQVIWLYPTAMAAAYWPAAKTILDSLTFEPSLLPIEASLESNAQSESVFQGEDSTTMCNPKNNHARK